MQQGLGLGRVCLRGSALRGMWQPISSVRLEFRFLVVCVDKRVL